MNLQTILTELIQERDRISQAIAAIESVSSGSGSGSTRTAGHPKTGGALLRKKPSHGVKRKVSALARRRMAQAQRARWAKVRGEAKATAPKLTLVKRTLSASARRKIAAAQRARWARVRAKQTA